MTLIHPEIAYEVYKQMYILSRRNPELSHERAKYLAAKIVRLNCHFDTEILKTKYELRGIK